MRAREIAMQGANGTLDANGRRILAQEIETIFDELVAAGQRAQFGWLGLRRDGERAVPSFLSSGPFVSGSAPPIVAFGGNSTEIAVAIDEGRRATATLDGRRVFMGDTDGDGLPDSGREDAFAVLARTLACARHRRSGCRRRDARPARQDAAPVLARTRARRRREPADRRGRRPARSREDLGRSFALRRRRTPTWRMCSRASSHRRRRSTRRSRRRRGPIQPSLLDFLG